MSLVSQGAQPASANAITCTAAPEEPFGYTGDEAVNFIKGKNYAVCSDPVAALTSEAQVEEHLFSLAWGPEGQPGYEGCIDCTSVMASSAIGCHGGTFRTEGRADGQGYPGDTGDWTDDSLSGNKDINCSLIDPNDR